MWSYVGKLEKFTQWYHIPTGDFWIDPNDGVPDDAVKVHCDFSFNATCLYANNEKKVYMLNITELPFFWKKQTHDLFSLSMVCV